jgi:hypothetical protein
MESARKNCGKPQKLSVWLAGIPASTEATHSPLESRSKREGEYEKCSKEVKSRK